MSRMAAQLPAPPRSPPATGHTSKQGTEHWSLLLRGLLRHAAGSLTGTQGPERSPPLITCSCVYSICTVLAGSALCVRLLLFGLLGRLLSVSCSCAYRHLVIFLTWYASVYIVHCALYATGLQGARL